jgi:SSS family solute:Na+ symporter
MAIVATLLVSALGIVTTLFLTTIGGAWFLIASLNGGIGIVYILRWYWWRINAWSELSCMVALLVGTLLIQSIAWGDEWKVARDQGVPYTGTAPVWFVNNLESNGVLAPVINSISMKVQWTREVTIADGTIVKVPRSINFAQMPFNILLLVPFSIIVWLSVTLLTKPTDRDALIRFYRRVRPGGPGWRAIASQCPDIPREETLLNRKNFLCWLLACIAIYAALFGMGDIFFFSTWRGVILLLVAFAAGWGVAVMLKDDGKPDRITDNPQDTHNAIPAQEGN